MEKLQAVIAIEHLKEVAKKLNLKVRQEPTGVKDSELGNERHIWLEDSSGNTKGSYFYWKVGNEINNSAGLSYTQFDKKANFTYKSVGDVKEIYKQFKIRIPRTKPVNKMVDYNNVPAIDRRWETVKSNYFKAAMSIYNQEDYEGSLKDMEKDNKGFIKRFQTFSETGLEEYFNKVQRELWTMEVWEAAELEAALFRIMDDYEYEGTGGFKNMSEISFTLSYYFTPILRVWMRWSPESIHLFWDLLGEN